MNRYDEDDSRADDFRCRGCEAPLTRGRGHYCAPCWKELGFSQDDDE